MNRHCKIVIREQKDLISARSTGREMARSCGFGSADQARLATAISELARNVLQYAGTGICTITEACENDTCQIIVLVEDNGPGIADVDRVLQDGYSTSGSLGAGLQGAKRLAHEFSIESEPGHTKVTFVISRKALA